MTSRRNLLKWTALAVPPLALGPRAFARPRGPDATAAGVLSEDFVFPEWLAALESVVARGSRAGDAASLAVLAPNGRFTRNPERPAGWLSLAAPGLEPFSMQTARALARLANDRLAALVRGSQGRLSGLATVSAADPQAVEEARRARALGLAGLSIGVNRGWRLDHPNVRALLSFAAAKRAPVYLPASFAPAAGQLPYRAEGAGGLIAGAASESGAHATQLIFGGLLDAEPHLQVVLARLGEATPYWWTRLRELEQTVRDAPGAGLRRSVDDYFARALVLTTADMTPATQRLCAARLPAGRLLRAAGVLA